MQSRGRGGRQGRDPSARGRGRVQKPQNKRWSEHWSVHRAEDGAPYYYNALTGERSWEPPPGFNETRQREVEADPAPVSSKPVFGTQWEEVLCRDGQIFYHHIPSKEVTWDMPTQVLVAKEAKIDENKARLLERAKEAGAVLAPVFTIDEGTVAQRQPADMVEDVEFEEEEENERDKEVIGIEHPAETKMSDAGRESQHAMQTGDVPDDAKVEEEEEFKVLLKEKGIHAFSRWETELIKIQEDERFQSVPPNKRRRLFESYCQDAGSVKTGKSSAPIVTAKEAFRALLMEKVDDIYVTWTDARTRIEHDPRYKAVAPQKREALFKEHILGLRKLFKGELGSVSKEQKAEVLKQAALRKVENERKAAEDRKRAALTAEGVLRYKTLLSELIKHPAMAKTWEVWRPRLENDLQGRGKVLSNYKMQELYSEHIDNLLHRYYTDPLLSLLDEKLSDIYNSDGGRAPALGYDWSAACAELGHPALIDDMGHDMAKCIWRHWVEKKLQLRGEPGDSERDRGDDKKRRTPILDAAYLREYVGHDAKRNRTDE